MNILRIVFYFNLFSANLTFAQTSRFIDSTTNLPYSIKDLLLQVQNNHPLMNVANLQTSYADANKLKSKGNFDPYLSFDSRQKTFDGKNYYNQNFFELDVFTASPITANVGLENTSGLYANSESLTPNGGLGYVGIQLPLLKN
jgi:hypothetical protein